MAFIHDDFLLDTKTARKLYQKYAEAEPIFDYHCHIPPADIAANRQFKNLFEIWLEGDHYKWRAMRNPLYHWTHLELKRYFDITDLLDGATAEKIWNKANEKLATPALTTQGI